MNKDKTITMFVHKTGGGAIYLVDSDDFGEAKIIIRLDGGAEVIRCLVEEEDSPTVNLIASGYEWDCPNCETFNHEIEATASVICKECGKVFVVSDYHHATG